MFLSTLLRECGSQRLFSSFFRWYCTHTRFINDAPGLCTFSEHESGPETTVWKYIRDLTVEDILPPRVVQTIHPTVKVCFQDCCVVVLGKIHDNPSDEVAWKLMFLLPRMLLTPLARRGKHGLHDVKAAYHQFLSWNWSDLICLTIFACESLFPGSHPLLGIMQKKPALRLVRCRELSRASRILTGNSLAPFTDDTARKLISKHPPRSSALHSPSTQC